MADTSKLAALVAVVLLIGCGGSDSLSGNGGTTGGSGSGAGGDAGASGVSGNAGTTGSAGTTGRGGTTGISGSTGEGNFSGRGGTVGTAGVTGSGGSRPACTGMPGTDRLPSAPAPAFGLRGSASLHAPGTIGVGDVNGDGKADLVALAPGSKGVLALNDGTGRFGSPTPFGATIDENEEIFRVVLADVNGDHLDDLFYTFYSKPGIEMDGLAVQLATGSTTFGPATEYPGVAYGAPFALTDVDGDGDRDLVMLGATPAGDYDVVVRPNPGTGAFGTPTHFPLGENGDAMAMGDLDGDGKPDLAAASYATGTVSVLRNFGDGTFEAPVDHPAAADGDSTTSLAIGDTDGDGRPDLVVTTYPQMETFYAWKPGSVSVLRNLGAGNFGAPVSRAVGVEPLLGVFSDLNADGKPDLTVANYESRDVSLLLNKGGGMFDGELRVGTGSPTIQLVAAELNGDGHADLVAGNDNGDVSVLLSSAPATLAAAIEYPAGPLGDGLTFVGGTSNSVAMGDLNADGKPDLVVTDSGNNRLGLLINAGNGTFAAARGRGLEDDALMGAVAIGDINGDGRADLIAGQVMGLDVSLGRADGTLAPGALYAEFLGLNALAVADLNGDGKTDVVMAKDAGVRVLLGTGNGNFAEGVSYPKGSGIASVTLGDLTGDGKPDLVVAIGGETRTVEVLVNKGNGTFADGFTLTTGAAPAGVAIADLDGDGKVDLAVASTLDVWCPAATGGVSVFINDGKRFAGPVHLAHGSYLAIAAVDLDGDGRPELAAAKETGVLEIFASGGTPLKLPERYAAPALPCAVVAGDLDGDGRADLAIASRFGSVSVVLSGRK